MGSSAVDKNLFEFTLRMGDNALILGHRVSVWCGHAPILEEDIALANVALDLTGQAKLWLDLAGEIEGQNRSADNLAFLRDARAFRNCLLVERPNGDFGQTLMRQFLFDAWHYPLLNALSSSSDERVAAIAEKSTKEAAYHLERSEDLVVRLGDGTAESHNRMQSALDMLWPLTGEMMVSDETDHDLLNRSITPDFSILKHQYSDYIKRVLREATLTIADEAPVRKGGKAGIHSEELGHILSDMQWMQRAYPGAEW